MKSFDIDSFDTYDDVFDDIERIAYDEFLNLVDMDCPIFFYGQIIDDCAFLADSVIGEEKTYCLCPYCGHLFELADEQKELGCIRCPECEQEGILANFRDEEQPLNEMCEQRIAYIQTYKDGYVLRLFVAYADYSNRPYDDYTTLSYYPDMRFFEYGREYYHDGELKYFTNPVEDAVEQQFVETNNIDDGDFWLANSPEDADSLYLFDLKYGGKPVMCYLTQKLSYNAFRCLQKYGFNGLVLSLLFHSESFTDSSKISEVLGVDYNQIKAGIGEELTYTELLAARKLNKLNIFPSYQNVGLMVEMEDKKSFSLINDVSKTFKYLRNQLNKSGCKKLGSDYLDYLDECVKLDFDMNDKRVLYPTDLSKAHTATSKLVEIKANELTEIGVAKAYEKYHNFCEYDNGKLCVIMPQSCEQIITEGKAQSHCVGNYIERVAAGEDLILFIRHSKEKDKPFYTLEIRPIMKNLNIVQCRGFKNKDVSAEIEYFLAEYGNWFARRTAKFDEQMSRVYYKAVKKIDGKYISAWDNKTEYIVGQTLDTALDTDPDKVAVKGIHVASLEFAQNYGEGWQDVAILELEVYIQDVVVPNAKDQIRASKVKVLREVPFEEMGEWGARHKLMQAQKLAQAA